MSVLFLITAAMVLVSALIVYPIILCLIDKLFGTHYSCSQVGWHNGNGGSTSFDGCSVHATCSKCGTDVMQDGQGNWF